MAPPELARHAPVVDALQPIYPNLQHGGHGTVSGVQVGVHVRGGRHVSVSVPVVYLFESIGDDLETAVIHHFHRSVCHVLRVSQARSWSQSRMNIQERRWEGWRRGIYENMLCLSALAIL